MIVTSAPLPYLVYVLFSLLLVEIAVVSSTKTKSGLLRGSAFVGSAVLSIVSLVMFIAIFCE